MKKEHRVRGNERLSIGQISTRTGLSISAIRFYEETGLVSPIRNDGGQRRFLRSDIRRLSFVLIAQQLGFTLEDIRKRLESLPSGRTPTLRDWTRISKQFSGVLDEKIALMTQMRDRLEGCIGCGCLSLENCTLYNADDRINKNGPGPRYIVGDSPE